MYTLGIIFVGVVIFFAGYVTALIVDAKLREQFEPSHVDFGADLP